MTASAHGSRGSTNGEPHARLVDGVLFDVDDTLVDTRGAFAQALAVVAREYLPALDSAESRAARDAELVVMWRADVNGHYRRYTEGHASYDAQRMARANELHAAFDGPALDDVGFAAWDAVFFGGFRAAWAAHTDAVDAVVRLLDAGIAVGALSNASTDLQTEKLAKAGLGDHVPMLVGVDTLGFGKPDPRVFAEACRRLGTDPSRTAYVGDELDVDAAAAKAAGLVGIWLDRPDSRRHEISDDAINAAAVHRVTTLSELPAALALTH